MFLTLKPTMPLRVVRLAQLLIAAALLSTGFSETVTQPTHEDIREGINSPMPYGFKYGAYGDDGGGHTREESADGSGRVVGSYTIFSPEGFLRRVFYEADENGFRARVETNEPGTKTSNPADVTIVSTADGGGPAGGGGVGGGTRDTPLPGGSTTRPVKTTSPDAEGTTNEVTETTTGLPPGYVLPERYRPNASRRPSGAELLTSRILTVDRPFDGDQVYPGRPGFDTDTNALNPPPPGIHTGAPPAGIVPVGPVQVTRVPGRPGVTPGPRPRTQINYGPSKDSFGQFDDSFAQGGGPSRPSFDGPFRVPGGSSGGIFSPSQVSPKGGFSGSQGFGPSAARGGGPGSRSPFANAGSPKGAGPGSFGTRRPGVNYPGAFSGGAGIGQSGPSGPGYQGGAGQQYQPPGLGVPLFTRVTQDSQKFPGRVDYSTQPGFRGPVQTGAPGAPGVFVRPSDSSRPSFGGRAPFGGPRFGPGGSFSGVPANQFDTQGPGGKRFGGPGQLSFQGGQAGNQGFPFGPGGTVGADIDGGSGADSSNEDGFAPNDPRRPFLFRNEDERPATPTGPATRGGAGQGDGSYAIQADNGKIQSVDFRPGSRPFQRTGPGNRFAANRGPFRQPALGATHREDPFRPYKPPPLESGHQDPIFVPQVFSGPGSSTTSLDDTEPQRIDGFKYRQQAPGFGGSRSPDGFPGNYPYRNTYSSGGSQPTTGARDQFPGRPQQPFSPFANRRPVPSVPTANFPKPQNHFANRFLDRTPAGTLGTPVASPAGFSPPSLVSMEVIQYGPQGPKAQSFNGSALPGSLAPPGNLQQVGGPLKPTRFPGNPFLANRLMPRPPVPVKGNANRVLYSEAPQQATLPRRHGEPKGNKDDYGGAFEGLIRDERPDLLQLKPKQKPSSSAQSQPGNNFDFLEDLLPFYEKDLDIGKKPNEAANGGDRKPVIHKPIVPEHRDLLCDDDDPRLLGPGQQSPDNIVRRPECINKPKHENGGSGEGVKSDGKNVEAPINPDEEFLNYRNPFSGVLPSLGAPEKVDRDSKQFQRPFLDTDKKVIPVLIDQIGPAVVLDGAVEANRNGLGPSTGKSDIPDRSSPELGAGSPVEGRRAFGHNGVFRTNFGPFSGSSSGQFGPRGAGPGQGFGSASGPRTQDGNFLRFPNAPGRSGNDLRNTQDPFNRNSQPFGDQHLSPQPPQQTLRFGQRLSGARNPNSLVPPRRLPSAQQQPEKRIYFPPPPLHRKAVLSPPDVPGGLENSFNGRGPFSFSQSQGVTRAGQPTVGSFQPGARAQGNDGAVLPRFGFVDSRQFRPRPSAGAVSGREDVGGDVDTLQKFVHDNSPPPASFSFSDAKKSPLVPRRPSLSGGRRKTLNSPPGDSGKGGQGQVTREAPEGAPRQDPASLSRRPFPDGNARNTEDLDSRTPNAVRGPFNFVDTRVPLDVARQRVVQRRPQAFDSPRQPGSLPARADAPALQGIPEDSILDDGRQGGFDGAPEDVTRQLLPTNRRVGGINGELIGPAVIIPQTGPVRQPVKMPRPILLKVERVPLGGTAIPEDLVSDKNPQDIQAFVQGPEQKLGQDITNQELLRRGANSAGAGEDGGSRKEDGEPERVNPYSFGYSAYDGLGSMTSRHETKDESGRVTGYYIVEDVDGRKRTVHYVADKDGFRATVHTNEQGTDNQDPANVKMRVENRMPHPSPTPRTPSPEKTSPSPTLGDGVDVPVLDAVDQSVKKS
ncbi:uncharacterized protein LOC119174625 isoform X1 [Rhipicephalus microplus]|uniref:uncharacterized protein LOC119174625 isoform X1 n=1 Tax=Rhipicephalus microplus TaxID=6941 RepID=UPI003F6CF2DE